MIDSFGDSETEHIFDGHYSKKAIRRLHPILWNVAQRKLHMINAAKVLEDLLIPPSNHLELLSGDMKGKYSIRINNQYRIIFQWSGENAANVKIIDYD